MKSIILGAISFLNPNQKKTFNLITLLIIFASLFEAFSIYILYLSIKIFTDYSKFIQEKNFFFNTYKKFGFSEDSFIVFFSTFLLFIFVFKFIYFSKMYYFQFKFINRLMIEISSNLLNKYLKSNFEFHTYEDNSKLIRNIKDEVGMFCNGLLQQIIIFFTEIAVFLSILILMFVLITKEFLILFFILLILSSLYYIFIKPVYSKFGSERQHYANLMIKYIINPITAIKAVKVFRAENYFLSKFKSSVEKLGHANAVVTTLNQIPRLGLELFVVICMSIFIIYKFSLSPAFTEDLSYVGILAVSLFKLIPSITKILNSLNGIKFSAPSLNVLNFKEEKDENEINHEFNKKFSFNNLIQLKNLSFRYKNKNKYIFEDINLEIQKNSSLGIIGKSGSGKSTLVDLIIGLLKPEKGSVIIDNNIDINKNYQRWLSIIGYVPQKVFIINDTLKKNIALGIEDERINLDRLKKVIQISQLSELLASLDNGLDTELGDGGKSISGGEAQRIGIARALYKDSDLLILDEITSSLDKNNENKIMDIIKDISKSKTIIVISHNEKNLNFCDEIYIIENGTITKCN